MTERLASLPAVETAIWQQLATCISDKSHAWRTAVLATIDGERADARTVVLRELDTHARRLFIYTDERAGKVHQLMQQSHGTLVMWSQALGWQLRCRVRLSIEMAGLSASSRWARLRLSPAAQDYLSPLAPGVPLPSDAPALPGGTRLFRRHRGGDRVARLARIARRWPPPRHLRRAGCALGAALEM